LRYLHIGFSFTREFSESFCCMVAAHVAGVPVEEMLPWVVPLGAFGFAGAAAWGREHLRISRRRDGSLRGRRGSR
jgi:hypothetical protein